VRPRRQGALLRGPSTSPLGVMRSAITRTLTLVAALGASATAYAEVSDKIPSLPRLGTEALVVVGLGVVAARFRFWLSLFPIAAAVALLLATWDMFQDGALARAILTEKGWWYAISAWVFAVAPLLIILGVVFVRWRSRHRDTGGP
jgi:hypothetical protein